MGLYLRQIIMLVWVRLLLDLKLRLVIMLLGPILIPLLILWLRVSAYGQPVLVRATSYEMHDVRNVTQPFIKQNVIPILWSPKECQMCECVLNEMNNLVRVKNERDKFQPVKVENELELEYRLFRDPPDKYLMGIAFSDELINAAFPKTLDLLTARLRFRPEFRTRDSLQLMRESKTWHWSTDRIYRRHPFYTVEDNVSNPIDGEVLGWAEEGYALVIAAVTQGMNQCVKLRWKSLLKDEGKYDSAIKVRAMADIDHYEDRAIYKFQFITPTAVSLSYIIFNFMHMHAIIRDKPMRHLYFNLYNISRVVYWFTWYLYIMLPSILFILVQIFSFKYNAHAIETRTGPKVFPVLPHGSKGEVFGAFLIHAHANFAWILFMSGFTNGPIIGTVLYLLTCTINIIFFLEYTSLKLIGALISLLSHNVLYAYVWRILFGVSVDFNEYMFDEIFKFTILHPMFTFRSLSTFLLLNAIVFGALGLALHTSTGRFQLLGWPLKFLRWQRTSSGKNFARQPHHVNAAHFERMMPDCRKEEPYVKVRGLFKSAGYDQAVADANLDVYRGETLFVCGRNNSGKSLLLACIAGVERPTSGSVCILHELPTRRTLLKHDIGYLGARHMLYETLTGYENMALFGRLRGLDVYDLYDDIEQLVTGLGMKRVLMKQPVGTLSTAMRRMVALGCAFVGGPRLICLDEPTQGLNFPARLAVWNFLQNLKFGRTFIIASNDMEEAEILCDRVAVMRDGCIIALGTVEFLLSIYEVAGYLVRIRTHEETDLTGMNKYLESELKEYKVMQVAPYEYVYSMAERERAKFSSIIKHLDTNRDVYRYVRYTIEKRGLKDVVHGCPEVAYIQCRKYPLGQFRTNKVPSLYSKFWLMYWKQLLMGYHDFHLLIIRLLLPLLATTLFATLKSKPFETQLPEMRLDSATQGYHKVVVSYASGTPIIERYLYPADYRVVLLQDVGDVNKYTILQQAKSVSDYYNISRNVLYWVEAHAESTLCIPNERMYLHALPICIATWGVWYSRPAIYLAPVPFQIETIYATTEIFDLHSFIFSMALVFGLALLGGLTLLQISTEIESGFYNLQMVYGASKLFYWLVAYLWDLMYYLFIIQFLLAIVYAKNISMFASYIDFIRIEYILVFFSIIAIPMIYAFALLFRLKYLAFGFLVSSSILLSIMPAILICFFQHMTYGMEDWLFFISPYFATLNSTYMIFRGLKKTHICEYAVTLSLLYKESYTREMAWDIICRKHSYCCVQKLTIREAFVDDLPHLTKILVSGAPYAFLFGALMMVVPTRLPRRTTDEKATHGVEILPYKNDELDEQVESMLYPPEQRKKNIAIGVMGLSRPNRLLDVSLTVAMGECFCMLGGYGAGKTTLFSMLANLESWTAGIVKILGKNPTSNRSKVSFNPEIDQLPDNIIVANLFEFFALLYGYSISDYKVFAQQMIAFGELYDVAYGKYGDLTDRNKQRVCNVFALLSNPKVVLWDNPTLGMDTEQRRTFWHMVESLKRANKCIFMTSHQFNETEFMCENVGILVDGTLVAIGPAHQLDEKYAQNLYIMIKLGTHPEDAGFSAECEKVESFIQLEFLRVEKILEFQDTLIFEVPHYKLYWQQIFDILHRALETLPIRSFTVRKQSLDQIYDVIKSVYAQKEKIAT